MTESDGDGFEHGETEDYQRQDTRASRPSNRFRFKDKRRSSPARRTTDRSRSRSPASRSSSDPHRHRRRRHRHHHGRHRSRRISPSPTPLPDADTAFRLSLFDALADDEGAAFWEGVYGQPIHSYSNTKVSTEGELERMTEEEYAAYVRQKMWEKSREGIEEERQARAQAKREREKSQAQQTKSENLPESQYRNIFDVEIEESLRRGERRKEEKLWRERWESYLKKWANLNALVEHRDSSPDLSTPSKKVWPWPTTSSNSSHIKHEDVEEFFRKCTAVSSEQHPSLALMTALKTERIRWHPDKIQQRYRNLGIVDEEVLRGVTAIFQIVDRLWNEERGKS